MTQKVTLSDHQWRKALTPGQFQVLREAKTEPPCKNQYWNNHQKGIYLCAACGNELFGSDTKFESRTGWPGFYAPLARDKVTVTTDTSLGMTRDEVRRALRSHLGHPFYDGLPSYSSSLLRELIGAQISKEVKGTMRVAGALIYGMKMSQTPLLVRRTR